MSWARSPWVLLILFGLLVPATRLPFAPGQLFSFDDVNFAYSIGRYDIRISQPQPPGYPLFVMEMRFLYWLRFRRPESILLALSLAGSLIALLLMVHCGNRMFGGDSGFWGACVLVLYPAFWYAGLTSAVRVQLAIASLSVAACCWKAWCGEGPWVRGSAIALAIGAGVRPELGVLLFPLWAACALRAPIDWKERGRALVWMAATILVWLLPATIASGGPIAFLHTTLNYLSDQASVGSGLFGASDRIWVRTVYWLLVWVFCGAIGLVLPAVLAWRRPDGWGIGGSRIAFLVLWFAPSFAFALNVHVEDPGQTLAMVPVVALLGGYWIERALQNCAVRFSRIPVPILLAAACALCRVWVYPNDVWRIQWLAVISLATGIALKLFTRKHDGFFPRWQTATLLLAPLIYIYPTIFHHRGWYFAGGASSGWQGAAEQGWANINSGFAAVSLEQIQTTVGTDDRSLREIRRLAAERPGRTAIVWEHGLTSWRKAAYYTADIEVFVLEHKRIRSGSPPVMAVWKGNRLTQHLQGEAPLELRVPAGTRIVWLLHPRTEFYERVRRNLPLQTAGPVYYSDLPHESGSRSLGEYVLAW